MLERHPQLCFEAHSTDYQTKEHLRQLVEDGFLILKVGPALTFALREALLALDRIDAELYPDAPSGYRAALEKTMAENPGSGKNITTAPRPSGASTASTACPTGSGTIPPSPPCMTRWSICWAGCVKRPSRRRF